MDETIQTIRANFDVAPMLVRPAISYLKEKSDSDEIPRQPVSTLLVKTKLKSRLLIKQK